LLKSTNLRIIKSTNTNSIKKQ